MRGWALFLMVAVATACTEDGRAPLGGGGGRGGRDLAIAVFSQEGSREVRRDEPLVLRFSAPLDSHSVAPGSVRVVRRRGNREIPMRVEVEGDRLLLHPPSPFGFDADARYRLVVEGFPSPRAPRSREGRPLSRRFRSSFSTSSFYSLDLEPPRPESVTLREEAGGWSVHIRFSEPVDPETVYPGITLQVSALDDGDEVPGRVIADRHAELFRFLPKPGLRPAAVRVLLTAGITDLAGNPLSVSNHDRSSWDVVLELPEVPDPAAAGEIAEDFTSIRMLDPLGTTALWNDPGAPGVLVGSPATTTLPLHGDPSDPETWFRIGAERVVLRILAGPEELGPARELTGLVLAAAQIELAPAVHEEVVVRVAPTRLERLPDPDLAEVVPEEVFVRNRFEIQGGRREPLVLPFDRPYSYDGESALLIEIEIGTADHTNLLRCRRSDGRRAMLVTGGKVRHVRAMVSLTSFSLEPTATSLFHDTGSGSPEYLDAIVHPESMPPGMTMELAFQGAHAIGPDGRPIAADPSLLSAWREDVRQVSGYRYLRFRVTFRGVSFSGEEPVLDDLIIPFRR